MVCDLYLNAGISVHVTRCLQKRNPAVRIGNPSVSRASDADFGAFSLRSGGHRSAGTCPPDKDIADAKQSEILQALKR